VGSIGYQGSTTRHLTEHYNVYNVGTAAGLALNQNVSGVTLYADDGSARFNALLLELKHTFSNSFQLDTQYRLSHTIDSGSNAYAGGFYQWNLATGFATSDYDVRHAFKVYGIWSPTIFKGSNGWMEKIAGGWSISGILNAHTGFPWTPQYGLCEIDGGIDPVFHFDPNSNCNGGGSSSDAGSGALLPAAYLGGFKANYRSNATVTAASLFTPPSTSGSVLFECLFVTGITANCPAGRASSVGPLPTAPGIGRNFFTGPGYFDVDATLSKAFGLPRMRIIGENAKLEFRMNFYNLFNKLNLRSDIQSDILNSHFGEAQAALGSRTIEIQARFSF
jgi:hypothetical protein